MAAMKEMSYPERLQAWSYNIIHYFGSWVSEANYSIWKTNELISVTVRSGENEEKANAIRLIRVRLFFHDLHAVLGNMSMGKRFLNDLFHMIWGAPRER